MQDLTWAEAIESGSESVAGFVLELPAALTSRLGVPKFGHPFAAKGGRHETWARSQGTNARYYKQASRMEANSPASAAK